LRPPGNLTLQLSSVVATGFVIAVIFTTLALQSGKSTWILGTTFLLVYCVIATR